MLLWEQIQMFTLVLVGKRCSRKCWRREESEGLKVQQLHELEPRLPEDPTGTRTSSENQ